MIKSYKVACWDKTGGDPAYNGLRFVDRMDAEVYAKDLYFRWTGLARWEIHESNEEPNKVFWHGRMLELFQAKRFTVKGFFRREKRYGLDAIKFQLERKLQRTMRMQERFALQVRDGIIAFEFAEKSSRMDLRSIEEGFAQ